MTITFIEVIVLTAIFLPLGVLFALVQDLRAKLKRVQRDIEDRETDEQYVADNGLVEKDRNSLKRDIHWEVAFTNLRHDLQRFVHEKGEELPQRFGLRLESETTDHKTGIIKRFCVVGNGPNRHDADIVILELKEKSLVAVPYVIVYGESQRMIGGFDKEMKTQFTNVVEAQIVAKDTISKFVEQAKAESEKTP